MSARRPVEPAGSGGSDRPPADEALLGVLRAVADRAAIAARLMPPSTEALLRSIVDATVMLFDAQAASIALHEPETDRLVFRVTAGQAGPGAVGLAIRSDAGIAGYVFTTGQALAVADVSADPRFGREAAEASGYVPRTLLAVPLVDDGGTLGVLEILDRHGERTFGLRDIDVATVFARQAAIALRATRLERDVAAILAGALAEMSTAAAGGASAEPAGAAGSRDSWAPAVDGEPAADAGPAAAAVRAAIISVDRDDAGRLWALADAVARAGTAAPGEIDFVIDILGLLAERAAGASGPGSRHPAADARPAADGG